MESSTVNKEDEGFHALVLGASGITGWAFTNQILNDYPRPGLWKSVTGVTRKPMSDEELSHWPQDERLAIAWGFDLHNDNEHILKQKLETKVKNIQKITHVYYLVNDPSPDSESASPFATSLGALNRTFSVIEVVSPNLKFIHLQYGTFIYGVCFPEDFYQPVPLVEKLPPLGAPLGDLLHYQVWTNFMKEFSKDKAWRWCETRPDEIIGFVPRVNSYNAVYPLAMYLSLYAHINGQGAECPFPGSFGTWKALCNQAGADMIAKQSIHLSLLEDPSINGEGFNVASSATPANWEMVWARICEWFGLVGKPPVDNELDSTKLPGPGEYTRAHEADYEAMLKKHNLKGWEVKSPSMDGSPNWGLTKLNFNRQLSLQKLRSTGFLEDEDITASWIRAFERMRKAKVIP